MAWEAAPWPLNPNRRSGHQQLVGVVDPPKGFGVAPPVGVVALHQPPVGCFHGSHRGTPGELQDSQRLDPLAVRRSVAAVLGTPALTLAGARASA